MEFPRGQHQRSVAGVHGIERSSFPIQFTKPLSTYYSATTLAQMQTVFANYAAQDTANRSILDISQVSPTIFSGGVYGGGDGSVHKNLDTQEWFGAQAVAACIEQGNCGTPISSLPADAPNCSFGCTWAGKLFGLCAILLLQSVVEMLCCGALGIIENDAC